ncbi:MAG: winged helix-turn-helix domain-containing protein [Opitutaceae bacterium]
MTRIRTISRSEARRFLRRAHLIDRPAEDVGAALSHHGYIQIDPINICGRMHDHILRNRVRGYAEGGLMRHLHGDGRPLGAGERTAFEHHLPSTGILAAFPLEAWPHLQAAMRARTREASAWSGRLTAREREFAGRMMERFAERGALGPEDFEDPRKGRRVWGSSTLAKSTLQKLFFHGRLLIVARDKNRRLYDLPERVLPAEVLSRRESTPAETARWLALTRLRQHRLVALRRSEVPLVEGLAEAVAVDGCPVLHCLKDDLPVLDQPDEAGREEAPILLAPLDPMIYDRRVTRGLWDFDYAWEAYMPAPKRKRGYYALPVLSGTELVGHVDLKADRERGRLGVVSRSVRTGHRTKHAVGLLARFLGLKTR